MKFGTVPQEPARQHTLEVCAPQFADAVTATLLDLRNAGFDPIVYETLRTPDRQSWLAGFGRDYDDGRGIVTHALEVWTTWHGFALGADIISESKDWGASDEFWVALGDAAERHGLAWGGRWKMRDLPHIQPAVCRTTPSGHAKALYDSGGYPAVWAAIYGEGI